MGSQRRGPDSFTTSTWQKIQKYGRPLLWPTTLKRFRNFLKKSMDVPTSRECLDTRFTAAGSPQWLDLKQLSPKHAETFTPRMDLSSGSICVRSLWSMSVDNPSAPGLPTRLESMLNLAMLLALHS